MDRLWPDFGPMISRKLFAIFFCLLFVGVGSAWAIESSEVASSKSTSVADGDMFVIAATYSNTKYYLTTTVSGNWGKCSTTLNDAAVFTAHVSSSKFYLTCTAGTMQANTGNFLAYNDGTTTNLQLGDGGEIVNKNSTTYFLDYNHNNGNGGARWYTANQSAIFYLFKVTLTPKTLTYNAGSGTCKANDTESSGGAGIVLPEASPSDLCDEDGWVFAGWKQTSAQTATTSVPTLYKAGTRYYPAADETSYAVYRKGDYSEIDFESETSAYTDWSFDNIKEKNVIAAHGGSKYGSNSNAGGNATASCVIKKLGQIATPKILQCYVSKETSNTTSSTWYVETSPNGNDTWESRGSLSATGMTAGVWSLFSVNLSSYTNVYVRIRYDGTNAFRAIDDIVLSGATFNSNPDCTYDHFVDVMHDNEIASVQGSYSMPAALSDADKGDERYCDELHYHFLGWVEESDLNENGTMKAGATLYPAGDAGHTADNKTFYAVWGKDE